MNSSEENKRVSVLHEHKILDTPVEDQYDDIVRIAAYICGVPIAAVTIIDEHRQWFKSITGIDIKETPRSLSFCSHTIESNSMMVVPDTLCDERFSNNPFVTSDPNVRFYAGVPLFSNDGYALGALCVVDKVPRSLTDDQATALRVLARQAAMQLQQDRQHREQDKLLQELQAEREFQTALIESLQEDILSCDADGKLTTFNSSTRKLERTSEIDVMPEQWAQHFGFYQVDGTTQMELEEVPLYRALMGEVVTSTEVSIVTHDGRHRVVLASGRAIYGENGDKLGAVVALNDVTEQRQNSLEIARLAAIVESSEEAIIGLNLSGTVVAWNNGAEALYGYTSGEALGRHASFLAKNQHRPFTEETSRRIVNGETLSPLEVVRETKSGNLKNVVLSFSPIRNTKGDVVGVSCFARDITLQKRAELALADSESRLRLLSEAAFEGIAVTRNGSIVDANPALVNELRYPDLAHMVGLVPCDLAAEESLEIIRHMTETRSPDAYEATMKRYDGTTFFAELRGRNTIIDNEPVRITAVRNVTRQKALETQLRDREAALRAVLESAPVVIYATDIDGVVTFAEGTLIEKAGLTPEAVVGSHVSKLFIGTPELNSHMERAMSGEDVVFDLTSNGLCLHTDLRSMRNADGALSGYIGVCFDVTERVASEERFRILFEQSPLPHVIIDDFAGIIDCNSATVDILRCHEKSAIINLDPATLAVEFQPDGRRSSDAFKEICNLARTNSGYTCEWQLQATDGQIFPLEICLTPVTLSDKPLLLAVWHDLTERKRQEEQINAHAMCLQFQKNELEKANQELESLATTDGLTGVKNHRAFQERLTVEMARALRHSHPLSLVIVDIDHFKEYNDSFGHQSGDRVLREFSRVLKNTARELDIVARYGGEEFVVILPETNLENGTILGERLRAAIEEHDWPLRPITASLGVSSFQLTDHSGEEIISRADTALYRAKASGRNRVSASEDDSVEIDTAPQAKGYHKR